jgi:hypothetical protein
MGQEILGRIYVIVFPSDAPVYIVGLVRKLLITRLIEQFFLL